MRGFSRFFVYVFGVVNLFSTRIETFSWSIINHHLYRLRLYSTNDNNNNHYDNSRDHERIKADAQRLEQTFRTLRDTQPFSADPLRNSQPSAEEIETILQRPAANASLNGDEDDNDMGVFLDADTYTHARDFLDADGSLRWSPEKRRQQTTDTFLQSFSQSPRQTRPPLSRTKASMGDLMEAMRQQRQKLDANFTSADLHQQILAEEEGFEKQSKVFRESLIDSTKALQASEIRSGEMFRQRQQKAMENLSREIDAFEATLLQNITQAKHPCARCGCKLSEDELKHAPSVSEAICRICLSEEMNEKYKLAERSEERQQQASTRYPSRFQYPNNGRFVSRQGPGGVQRRNSAPTRIQSAPVSRPNGEVQPKLLVTPPPSRIQKDPPVRQPATPRSIRMPLRDNNNNNNKGRTPPSQLPRTVASRGPKRSVGVRRPGNRKIVKMEDPDTGKPFLWNKETGDIEWIED